MADLRLLIEVLTKGQGDLRRLNSDLKKTGDEAEKTGNQIGNIGKTIGAFATGFLAFKAIDFLADATNAAAEFNDTMSATGVIIGEDALPELEKWADQAAQAFGASKQDALEAANTFATFGKSAGLAGQELVTFSTDLTELAGDLASFRGGTTEEAITAIGAALRGESEPIRRYGVLLDDATLRQRALKLGIIETTKQALTPQQRVLAAQAEIFAQTADAQGDYARTADELANKQRELGAELENVSIEIGQKLVPIMLDLANVINDNIVPAVDVFLDNVGQIGDGIGHLQDLGTPSVLLEMHEATEDTAAALEDFADGIDENGKQIRDFRLDLQPMADDAALQAEAAADGMAGEIGEAPQKMADELLANQFVLKPALEELIAFMEESLAPGQQMMEAVGFLMSGELADGLASNNPYVRQKAQEMQAEAIAALNANLFLAMDAGAALAATYAAGIVNNLGVVRDAGRQLAGGVRAPIGIESEPEDRGSPLYGITKWGYNIARTIAEGMRSGVSLVSGATSTLASAIAPGTLEGFSVAPGAIPDATTGTVGAGGIHIHLYNMGDPITEDDDVLESLRLLVPHIRDAALSNG